MSRVQFEKSIFFFQSTDLSFALLVAFDLFLLLDDKPWSHRPIHRPYLVRAPVARLANRFVRVVDTPAAHDTARNRDRMLGPVVQHLQSDCNRILGRLPLLNLALLVLLDGLHSAGVVHDLRLRRVQDLVRIANVVEPGGSVRGERANFTRLVLGCIEAGKQANKYVWFFSEKNVFKPKHPRATQIRLT